MTELKTLKDLRFNITEKKMTWYLWLLTFVAIIFIIAILNIIIEQVWFANHSFPTIVNWSLTK